MLMPNPQFPLQQVNMASTSGTVITRAASHLNDSNQLTYTSAILLPFFNMALDELEEELAVYELTPMVRGSIVIEVPIGSLLLPQMPTNFVEAISLLERANNSSDRWREVKESRYIDPNFTVNSSTEILQWTVRGPQVYINPPSSDREVLLEFVAGLTTATTSGTAVDIESSRHFLGLVTARNAARDLGNSDRKANSLEAYITRSRDRVVRRLQKNNQSVAGVRRRAYSGVR